MEITIKIFRYNPEKDKRGHYETYKLEGDENDRVLDVLEYVKGTQDGTLSFRRSCAHGVCGSDAIRINGRNHAGLQNFGARCGREYHGGACAGLEDRQGSDRGYGAVL